jgi:hypothetical protein
MHSSIKSMSLGDIFENLFKLAGKTALRNLIVITILLLPSALILVYGIDSFFSSIINLAEQGDEFGGMDSESIISIISMSVVYGITILIFTIGTLLATLAVTIIATNHFAGNEINWQDGLKEAFSIKFWRIVGASIIESFSIFGIIFIPFIILIALAATQNGFAIFIGVVILLAAIAAVIFVAVKWSFVFPTISYEDTGVIESLRRSWYLVGGYWWRTFGIIILLNILVSFAVSIITTPLSFAVMWDIFADLFSRMDMNNYEEPAPFEMIELFSSMGIRMGIITTISSVLSLLITPLISVVMYFDLRAKKNEFAENQVDEGPEEIDNSIDLF